MGEDLHDDPPPPDGAAPTGTVGRRHVLRLLGVAAAAIAPIPLLHRTVGAAEAPPVGPHQHRSEAPAKGEAGGKLLRRWTMVIDLRKCDGCQSVGRPPQCTAACIEGHYAPKPMEWIQVFESPHAGGHETHAVSGTSSPGHAGTFFQPVPCQQCQNPPCTNVCPVGATFSTPEGTVLIDQDRCIGCRICMAACPYDRRFFNWGTPTTPKQVATADYSPEHQAPARRGTVMKCDFCPEMARSGRLPFCAQACPHNAIYYGDLEEGLATNGIDVVDVHRFIVEQHATRLKEDLGTQPRVYYIPGHGELVGRDPSTHGRLPTQWLWQEKDGGVTWER